MVGHASCISLKSAKLEKYLSDTSRHFGVRSASLRSLTEIGARKCVPQAVSLRYSLSFWNPRRGSGGERGIRTPDGLAPITVFETAMGRASNCFYLFNFSYR